MTAEMLASIVDRCPWELVPTVLELTANAPCLIRSMTQALAEGYKDRRPGLKTAFENLQIRRGALQRQASRTPAQNAELDAMTQLEPTLQEMVNKLPEVLPEPACPQLRQAYTAD